MEKQKLVILDLDNTLWDGILAENYDVQLRFRAAEVIERLVNNGIMVSVASKNDYHQAKQKLEELDLWQWIVLPQINYLGKAKNIAQIIRDSHLQPHNITFIDDEPRNRAEVLAQFPTMNVCEPDFFNSLFFHSAYEGKPDLKHSRLKQFRILEKKAEALAETDSNDTFLRESNIQVRLNQADPNWDRVLELNERARQLNYTRQPLIPDALIARGDEIDMGEVYVTDAYGDYGMAGFYAVDKATNRLLHFFFSCRLLGMGVEAWLYRQLGQPILQTELSTERLLPTVDWITRVETLPEAVRQTDNRDVVFMKGGCLFVAFQPVLTGTDYDCKVEVPGAAAQYHTETLKNILLADPATLEEIREHCPWLEKDFYQSYLQTRRMKTLLVDLVLDSRNFLYRDKQTGLLVDFDVQTDCLTSGNMETVLAECHRYDTERQWRQPLVTPEFLARFRERFEPYGVLSVQEVMANLNQLQKTLNCRVIPVCRHNQETFENALRELARENPKIQPFYAGRVILPSEISEDQEHYARMALIRMAKEIAVMLGKDTAPLSATEALYNLIPDWSRLLYYQTIRPRLKAMFHAAKRSLKTRTLIFSRS